MITWFTHLDVIIWLSQALSKLILLQTTEIILLFMSYLLPKAKKLKYGFLKRLKNGHFK